MITIRLIRPSVYEIKIDTEDFAGLQAITTGLFTCYGLNIVKAHILTHRKRAMDVYEVQSKSSMDKSDWKGLKSEYQDYVNRAKASDYKAISFELNQRIVNYLRLQHVTYSEKPTPAKFIIQKKYSYKETVFDIESKDAPAFLYNLTSALTTMGIDVVRIEVETRRHRIYDRFWVTNQKGKRMNADELKALEWAVLLVREFSSLLPKVPDPRLALDHIMRFGQDVFKRDDFRKILLLLKKPQSIQVLSRILGTSPFLWEEFLKLHNQSILQIMGDHKLLEDNPQKSQMMRSFKKKLVGVRGLQKRIEVLNQLKDQMMFRIDLRQLMNAHDYFGQFGEELSDLVDVVVELACQMAIAESLKIFPKKIQTHLKKTEFCVLALGKLGGRELGFASDLELMFVYDQGDSESPLGQKRFEFFQEVVRQFRLMIYAKSEGIFEIDLRLRPRANDGPLAPSLELFKSYYSVDGDAWNFERQALVKLRSIFGSNGLSQQLIRIRNQYVFGQEPFQFKEALRLRKRQRTELVKSGHQNAKYSAGGLLDVEYYIQTLQLIHGQASRKTLHETNTMEALKSLRRSKIIDKMVYESVSNAYIFLRRLINRLRMVRGHAKDLSIPPMNSSEFVLLARRMEYVGSDFMVSEIFKSELKHHMNIAKELYESLMKHNIQKLEGKNKLKGRSAPYPKKLKDSGARVVSPASIGSDRKSDGDAQLVDEAFVRMRSQRSGTTLKLYDKAIRMIKSRNYSASNLKKAVLALERCVETHEKPDELLASLAHSEKSCRIAMNVLGFSEYLTDLLIENPDAWAWMSYSPNRLLKEFYGVLKKKTKKKQMHQEIVRLRHRETLRIAILDFLGEDLEKVYKAFSDLAEWVIGQIFEMTLGKYRQYVCVLALGKLGGEELNFSSDVDLIFLADPTPNDDGLLTHFQSFIQLLQKKEGGYFLYRVDMRLRPHGDMGHLYLSHKDYCDYYHSQADTWEMQALIKARPIAGSIQRGKKLLQDLKSRVYRNKWLAKDIQRLRDIKKKFEDNTRSKGESGINIKMGDGGIRDIEFSIQMIQLLKGNSIVSLQKANTLKALKEIERRGLLGKHEGSILYDGYLLLRRIENFLHLSENKQTFLLPEESEGWSQLEEYMNSKGIEGKKKIGNFDGLKTLLEFRKGEIRDIFETVFFGKK